MSNNIQPVRVISQKVWYRVEPDTYNDGCFAIEIEIEDQFDCPTPIIIRYPLIVGIATIETANMLAEDLTHAYEDALNDLHHTKDLCFCERCHGMFMPKVMKELGGKLYCKDCKDLFLMWRRHDKERNKFIIKADELLEEGDVNGES